MYRLGLSRTMGIWSAGVPASTLVPRRAAVSPWIKPLTTYPPTQPFSTLTSDKPKTGTGDAASANRWDSLIDSG